MGQHPGQGSPLLPIGPSIGIHISGFGHQFPSIPTVQVFSVALQRAGHHDGHVVPLCPAAPSMGMQVFGSWQLFASIPPVQIISLG